MLVKKKQLLITTHKPKDDKVLSLKFVYFGSPSNLFDWVLDRTVRFIRRDQTLRIDATVFEVTFG